MVIPQRLDATLWKNALWLIGGNGLRLLLSGLYFICLTRLLGPEGFGLFSAILACTNLMAPLAYMGQPQLLTQQLSRDPRYTQRMWSQAWMITVGLGSTLTVLLCGPLHAWLPGTSWAAVGVLLFSELVIVGLQYVHKGVLIAYEQISLVSIIDTGMALARLLAVLIAGRLGLQTLWQWSIVYLVMAGIIAIATHRPLTSRIESLGLRTIKTWIPSRDWFTQALAGWDFAIGGLAILAFMDLDKLLLPRLSSPVEAGEYSAAYRLITFAQIPIMALMTSSFAEVCRRGKGSLRQGIHYGALLTPWILLYGSVAALAVVLLAGIVPGVLGEGYGETALILRWLSVLIFLEGIHLLVATILAGADLLTWRSRIQLMALGLNGLLNLLWIPTWGWRGAAAATLVAEVGLIVALVGYMAWCLRLETAMPVDREGSG